MRTSHLPHTSLKARVTLVTLAVCFAALSLYSLHPILDAWHLVIAAAGSLLPLALVTDQIRRSRKHSHARHAYRQWLQKGQDLVTLALQPNHGLSELSRVLLSSIAEYLDCPVGLFYYAYDRGLLLLESSHGIEEDRVPARTPDEGPISRCATLGEPVVLALSESPDSSLGKLASPAAVETLVHYPLLVDGELLGVLALALPHADPTSSLHLLDQLAPHLEGALARVSSEEKTRELLRVTQAQAKALERHRREVQEKAEALARATRYKSRFLANMSHELRSPLNSILLLAQMTAEKPSPAPQVQENARIIQRCSEELLFLIEDILDLSKVEAGKLDYNLGAVDLRGLAFTLESSQGPLARRKDLEFVIQPAAGLPDEVVTDGKRVLQIVRNLVANAIKFTEKGQVTVGMDWRETARPQTDGELVIAVTDTGPGIDPDEQERIFAEFEQASGTQERGYGGTGLGLSISRRLAEDLGGTLELLSSPGLGSTFTLRLPCAVVSAAAPSEEESPAEREAARIAEQITLALAEEGDGESPARPAVASPDPATPESATASPAAASPWSGLEILLLGSDMRRLFGLLAQLESRQASARATGDPHQGRLILDQSPGLDLLVVEGPLHTLQGKDLDRLLAAARRRGVPAVLRLDPELAGAEEPENRDPRFIRALTWNDDLTGLDPAELLAPPPAVDSASAPAALLTC